MRTPLLAAVALCVALAALACGGLIPGPSAAGSNGILPAASRSLAVEAFEYGFRFEDARIPRGVTNFHVSNTGTQPHEFLVVPVEGSRYGLPLAHVELREPRTSATVTVNLKAGAYALVCLLQLETAGGLVSHLALGMIEPFEVTE